MPSKAGIGGSGALVWAAVAASVLVAASAAFYVAGRGEAPGLLQDAPPPGSAQPDPETGEAPAAAEPTAEPGETAGAEPAPDLSTLPPLSAPVFDVVRVDPDGAAVIAGRAAPGSTVTVTLDDVEQARVETDETGGFVSLFTVAPGETPGVIGLRAQQGDRSARSEEEIILAPVQAPDPQPAPAVAAQGGGAAAPAVSGAGEGSVLSAEGEQHEAPDEPAGSARPASDAASGPAETASAAREDGVPVTGRAMAPVPELTQDAAAAAPAPDPAPFAILRNSPAGVELMQPLPRATPEEPARVALDTIGYSALGEVLLGGRARGGSVVRVYLDTRPLADLTAQTDGRWTARLGGIAPGVYTLRLDEIAADGRVLSRMETPFKREAPEALDLPRHASPADAPPIRAVTVQTGDTLWAISRERYGDGLLYVRVFEANRASIRDPDLIYPGQIFSLPD